jgi:hypothetical protein
VTFDWTAIAALATCVAAITTAVTIIFIAKQTSATRRAAEAADTSVKVATDALALASKEHQQTRFLTLESIRGRIDAAMPQLTVSEVRLDWPPLVPSSFGEAQPYSPAAPYRLPRQAPERLMVRAYFTLSNDDSRTVTLTFSQPVYQSTSTDREVFDQVTLAPGKSLREHYFEVDRSVGEWVDIWNERNETRAGGPEQRFYAMYTAPADTGAVDYYNIVVAGTLVEPVPDETGAWRVIANGGPSATGAIGAIVAVPQTNTRVYWLSRERGLQLPPIDLDWVNED